MGNEKWELIKIEEAAVDQCLCISGGGGSHFLMVTPGFNPGENDLLNSRYGF